MSPPLMNEMEVPWKMKLRSIWSDDRSWPFRLTDLNKCYDSCISDIFKLHDLLQAFFEIKSTQGIYEMHDAKLIHKNALNWIS